MYWIVTENTADLPLDYIAAQDHFQVIRMTCLMDGKPFVPDGSIEGSKKIYDAMRAGSVIKTAQVTAQEWKDSLTPLLEGGEDVLVIAFSSGLSGTAAAAAQAAESLRKLYPERTIALIDSLAASMGEGLFTHYALQNRKNGMSISENLIWLQAHVLKLCHWFTVDDLMFLKRGGRVSATSAMIGTMIQIKPVLNVDDEGHLIPKEKVQGRKRSLRKLVEKCAEYAVNPSEQTMFISHGDCQEDADYVEGLLKSQLGVKEVLQGYIGPVIGAHSGPGTVALFFIGKERG